MSAALYSRRRYRRVADGTWLYPVPTETVSGHVSTLRASGMTWAEIAADARVAERTLRGLGDHVTLRGATAAAILAVAPRPQASRLPRNLVPGLRSARQVQGLAAIGWPLTEQAHRMGMHPKTGWLISRAADKCVSVDTRGRVDLLFDELAETPGPSMAARRAAANNGWLPALVWTDLDDPDDDPLAVDRGYVDEVAVERVLAGEHLKLTDAETIAVIQTGTARDIPLSQLADRLGLSGTTARKLLGGDLSPRKEKAARVEAEILRSSAGDYVIAAQLGVARSTVSRARARLVASGVLAVA